jgi:hypothetical protein
MTCSFGKTELACARLEGWDGHGVGQCFETHRSPSAAMLLSMRVGKRGATIFAACVRTMT